MEYEVKRQARILDAGEEVVQETLLFDASTGKTVAMRGKEEADDYRYFPEPDLVHVEIRDEWIEEIQPTLPELPAAAPRTLHFRLRHLLRKRRILNQHPTTR